MQTIVTIGSGYSGSSALFDFLKISQLFYDPFNNKEFSLMYDPGGIKDIEQSIRFNFTPNKNTYLFNQFKKNIEYYVSSEKNFKPGQNLYLENYNLEKILLNYLNSISSVIYEAESNLLKYNNSRIDILKKKIFKFLFKKKIKKKMILFCELNEFLNKTQNLFHELLLSNNNKKDIIIDQGGTIWNPISTTKYYINPKIIIVNRDPRDIFSEFKEKTASSFPGNDVEIFCHWFKNIKNKINKKEYTYSNLLIVNFEDLIFDNENCTKIISNFTNVNLDNSKKNFNFDRSKKNILRYRNNLKNFEIKKIEDLLSEYLYNFN
jgi:hypothetical protein